MLDEKQAVETSGEDLSGVRDENGAIRAELVERAAAAAEASDADALKDLIGEWHEADIGDLIAALDPALRVKLVELSGPQFKFKALTELDEAVRNEILEALAPDLVAAGVHELETDDAVSILAGLPKERQRDILERLPHAERVAFARSLEYPEDSAGRRMQTEYIAVRPDATVGQTIDYMRETADLPE